MSGAGNYSYVEPDNDWLMGWAFQERLQTFSDWFDELGIEGSPRLPRSHENQFLFRLTQLRNNVVRRFTALTQEDPWFERFENTVDRVWQNPELEQNVRIMNWIITRWNERYRGQHAQFQQDYNQLVDLIQRLAWSLFYDVETRPYVKAQIEALECKGLIERALQPLNTAQNLIENAEMPEFDDLQEDIGQYHLNNLFGGYQ